MLINTVLIFLKNALPAFFLIAVTASILQPYTIRMRTKIWVVISAISAAIILSQTMNFLSQFFDGVGAELITALIHILLFLVLLTQLFLNSSQTDKSNLTLQFDFFLLGMFLAIILNGTNLLIYVNGFWSLQNTNNSIIIGSILGLGISLSSALLLLYILRSKIFFHWFKLPYLAFIFTSARQLSEFSLQLLQADWLASSEAVWDSSKFVLNNSETGRFMNALIGYESTPSFIQIIFYFCGLIIPLFIIYFTSKANPKVRL